jgi:hypothetical protein
VVAPADTQSYFKVYDMYEPSWKLLGKHASEKVRAWEQAQVK